MKVGGSSRAASIGGAGAARGAVAAGGFSVGGPATASAKAAGAATGASGVGSLDSLLMLQEPDDALTRRRRAVRRADGLLDRLDALKLAALGEGDASSALTRLSAAVRERRGDVDDAGLADVLEAVETVQRWSWRSANCERRRDPDDAHFAAGMRQGMRHRHG